MEEKDKEKESGSKAEETQEKGPSSKQAAAKVAQTEVSPQELRKLKRKAQASKHITRLFILAMIFGILPFQMWLTRSDYDRICDITEDFKYRFEHNYIPLHERTHRLFAELDSSVWSPEGAELLSALEHADARTRVEMVRKAGKNRLGRDWECAGLEAFFMLQ